MKTSRANPTNRGAQLRLIYRWTHRDFKASPGRVPSLMLLRDGKTTLVPLESLTDAEIAERLPNAMRLQAEFEARTARPKPKES